MIRNADTDGAVVIIIEMLELWVFWENQSEFAWDVFVNQ